MESNLDKELAVFDPIVAGLEELKAEALGLRVKDHTDKKGYQLVKSFRNQNLVKLRTTLESERKRVKSFYLEAGKAIDGKAKDLASQIEAIEAICKEQEKIVDDYEAKLKAEAEAKKQAILDERVSKLEAVKAFINTTLIGAMTDDEYNTYLTKETERFSKEEEARIAQEKELERLKEVERQAQAKLDEERKKAEEANREVIRLQQIELAKRDAELAEQRKIEAERQASELKAKQEQEAKERAGKEAKAKADAELLRQAKDKKLVQFVLASYDTLEKSQAEIVRLYKQFNIEVK